MRDGIICDSFELDNDTVWYDAVHRPENVYYEQFLEQLEKAIKLGNELGIDVETKPFNNLLN